MKTGKKRIDKSPTPTNMIALDYLYFRILKLIKLISLSNSFYYSRAVFFFSLMTGLNISSLISLLGFRIFENTYITIFGAIIWFVIWFRVFTTPRRYKEILHRFDNETVIGGIIGGVITVLYMIFSFIFFIKVAVG